MLAKTESVALVGAEARLVELEVHASTGVPCLTIVGLPAASVREAEQRTRSAIESSSEAWPKQRMTVNLAPGALRKEGTHFDLAMALGILAAQGRLEAARLEGWVALGELALNGSVRAVRGVLAAAITCRATRRRGLICPAANASEAALVDGIEVVPVGSLRECLAFLRGETAPPRPQPAPPGPTAKLPDISDVRGHEPPKRALEVAAAGGHNLMLEGPPGSGKTMLASRLPGILPPMSAEESLEVTRVYSVAGLLGEGAGLMSRRPFRSPHHHLSMAGLIGGGSGLPRPGEASLAHHGVLFLDEMPLYKREALESLRAPLEEGRVRIARAAGTVTYPCRFSLVAAMNPCPCGHLGDPKKNCRCSDVQRQSYCARLSGPLLDRFDMQVLMDRLTREQLLGAPEGECSEVIRARVEAARAVQHERYGSPLLTNATAPSRVLERSVRLSPAARTMLGNAIDNLSLSGRGLVRVMRVARTVADLGRQAEVEDEHVQEALGLRLNDSKSEVAA